MTTPIYIAGASTEAHQVARYIHRARLAGLDVTHDWTRDVIANAERGRTDASFTDTEAESYAIADSDGVYLADVLWLIAPATKSEGAWWELGLATGLRKVTIVSGPTSNIFRTLATVRFPTHEDALAHLTEVYGRGYAQTV